VLKTSEQVTTVWEEKRLAKACREGYTLIYDEFTRSQAEANNVLLSILEERILNLPRRGSQGEDYIRVHPNFRAIFTSNTAEYAGTHATQSALIDRLVTVELSHPDRETEIQIAQARSRISASTAERLVDLVRTVRADMGRQQGPSVRASIMLARIFVGHEEDIAPDAPFFRDVCADVLRPSRTARADQDSDAVRTHVDRAIEAVF